MNNIKSYEEYCIDEGLFTSAASNFAKKIMNPADTIQQGLDYIKNRKKDIQDLKNLTEPQTNTLNQINVADVMSFLQTEMRKTNSNMVNGNNIIAYIQQKLEKTKKVKLDLEDSPGFFSNIMSRFKNLFRQHKKDLATVYQNKGKVLLLMELKKKKQFDDGTPMAEYEKQLLSLNKDIDYLNQILDLKGDKKKPIVGLSVV